MMERIIVEVDEIYAKKWQDSSVEKKACKKFGNID